MAQRKSITAKVIQEKTTFVDENTGEEYQEHRSLVQMEQIEGYTSMYLPQKHMFNRTFVTLFQSPLLLICKQANLTKDEMRILLYLLATCGIDNSVEINLNTISEELNIKKPNVSTAIKGLKKRNIIVVKERNNYRSPKTMDLFINYDQLNYNFSYKAKTKEYKENVKKHPPLLESDGVTILEDHTKGKRYLSSGNTIISEQNLFDIDDLK